MAIPPSEHNPNSANRSVSSGDERIPSSRHSKSVLSALSKDSLWANSSAKAFNRLRAPSGSEDRQLSLTGPKITGRDLSLHDLSDVHFSEFTFEDVQFGNLQNVEFAGCTFKDCRFVGKIGRNPYLKGGGTLDNIVFYECTFDDTHLDRSHLSDIQIAKCIFAKVPRFAESKVLRTLSIVQSGKAETFQNLPDLDMRSESSTLFTDISIKRRCGIDWGFLRAVAQIPFLQASLLGLTFLAAQVFLVNFLFALASRPEQSCRQIQAQVTQHLPPEVAARVESFCARFDPHALLQGLGGGLLETLALFVFLFAASLAHKLASPSEVLEYSFNQWRVDNGRPGLFYQILAQRRQGWLFSVIGLYVIALCIFVHLIATKVGAIINSVL